jgi:ribonuclease P protein component
VPGSRATFAPQDRLKGRGQFLQVFRRGERVDGDWFLLVAAQNDVGRGRLGLAIGRRVGGAVARNRARRLFREAFRRNHEIGPGSQDLVIVGKPGLAGRGFSEIEREYKRRLERLAQQRARRGRRSAAVVD